MGNGYGPRYARTAPEPGREYPHMPLNARGQPDVRKSLANLRDFNRNTVLKPG